MTTTGPAPRHRAAVIGSPVAHSLSPVLHRAAYADLGLEGWEYAPRDVAPGALAGVLAELAAPCGPGPAWAGTGRARASPRRAWASCPGARRGRASSWPSPRPT